MAHSSTKRASPAPLAHNLRLSRSDPRPAARLRAPQSDSLPSPSASNAGPLVPRRSSAVSLARSCGAGFSPITQTLDEEEDSATSGRSPSQERVHLSPSASATSGSPSRRPTDLVLRYGGLAYTAPRPPNPARANTTAAPRDRPHPPTPGPRVLMRGHTRDPHRRASATSRPPPRPCPGQYCHYAGLHYAAASPNWPLWLLDNDPRCLADSAAILPLSLPPAQFQADSTLLTLAASSPPQSHALSCFPITTDSGPTAAALPKYCKKISYTVRLKNFLLLTPPNTPKTP
jgi:hypothetical protein